MFLNVTLVKLLQYSNAYLPIEVTLDGISTFLKLLQYSNAEPSIEVNRLLCGGRCGFRATRSGFILPLEDLESFSDYLGSGGGNGLTYKEYLGIMLNENTLRDSKRRFMDIVEMDMKKHENGSFTIDGLVGYIEAKGRFLSRQGYERVIRRAYAY